MSCTSRELTRVGNRRLLTPDDMPLTPLVSQPWEPSELDTIAFFSCLLTRTLRLVLESSETQVMWGNK